MIDLSIVEYVNDLLVDNLNAKLLLKPLVDMAEEEGKEDAQASRLNKREERWAGQSKAGQSDKIYMISHGNQKGEIENEEAY